MRRYSPLFHPDSPGAEAPAPKIQAFSQSLGAPRKAEEKWKRSPVASGSGAMHMKSFHCKLSDDALSFIDQQINDWLDAHPNYKVKLVSSNIGEWSGKLGKESHLVVQVWV